MTTTPTMEQEIPVTFAERELADKGQELARMILRRTSLVDAKKADQKKRQEEIDELDDEIAEFAQSISDGFENRKQRDLFHDQTLPPAAASQRLAEIVAWSAKHPFVADAEKIDTCSVEGCGAQAGADVHVRPEPSKPHKFVGDGSGEDKCWGCGSGALDPIHAEPIAATEETRPDDAHPGDQVESIAKVCSRCGTVQTSADVVLYDADVKPVCDPCVRGAIEAGTWPHAFKLAPGIGVASRTSRCQLCKKRQDDAVHVEEPPAAPAPAEETAALQYTAEEMEAAARVAASGDPAPAFDPALDEVDTPAEGGGAGA